MTRICHLFCAMTDFSLKKNLSIVLKMYSMVRLRISIPIRGLGLHRSTIFSLKSPIKADICIQLTGKHYKPIKDGIFN